MGEKKDTEFLRFYKTSRHCCALCIHSMWPWKSAFHEQDICIILEARGEISTTQFIFSTYRPRPHC